MALDKNKVYAVNITVASVGDEEDFEFSVSFDPPLTSVDLKGSDQAPASWEAAGEVIKFLAHIGNFEDAEVYADVDATSEFPEPVEPSNVLHLPTSGRSTS